MVYTYPQSVKEAAKILDKDMPGWEKKIDLENFHIHSTEYCPLSRVYGGYSTGLRHLFGNSNDTGGFFANRETNDEWLKEIQLRLDRKLNEVQEVHDFAWALRQMQQGKKVVYSGMDTELYFFIEGSYVKQQYLKHPDIKVCGDLHIFSVDCGTYARKWRIYEEPKPKLSSLKPGDKFTWPEARDLGPFVFLNNKDRAKGSHKYHYIDNKSVLCGNDYDREVELVK